MNSSTKKQALPYSVRKTIGCYRFAWQGEIIKVVRKKMASLDRPITAEEIGECASQVVFGECDYNRRMEALCLKAIDHGEYTTLREAIDELRASISESAQG